MAETCLQIRRELEKHHLNLEGVSTTLTAAVRAEDPVLLPVEQCKELMKELESTKEKMDSAMLRLASKGEEGEAADEDATTEARLRLKWTQLHSLLKGIITLETATQLSKKLHNSMKRLEKIQLENPTKDFKGAVASLERQMEVLGQALDGAILPEGNTLWDEYAEYEERIFTMMGAETAPPDVKDRGKVHGKGSFKVSALAVPKFDGKITSWVSFWQEFEMAIHKKVDMLDEVKMVYLKQAIQEPGLQTTIADLGIEDGSYAAAVKLLQNRYEKPRVMHRLFSDDLRDLKSKSKAGLHQLADSAQHILLGFTRLKKLGISEVITSSVESVMGPELREQWLNHSEAFKETPPAEKIIEFLRMRADREEGNNISKPHYLDQKNKQKPTKRKGLVAGTPVASQPAVVATPSTAPRAAPSGTYDPSQKREPAPCKYDCSLCHEKHYCYHCSKFKAFTPKQRREHATANKLCINCLKPNHTAEQCRSLYRCSVCTQKHNSLVHEEGPVLSSPALGLASASATIPDGLLMTANVLVTGSNGIQTTARAFIDSGSSVTLISNKLKTALALKSTGQHMSIDGVAGFVGETQHPVVKLTLSSPRDKTWERQITAIALPKVIRDLPLRDASSTIGLPHLQKLELADPLYHKVGPVDMLLGLDVFPYIFRPGKEEGPPNTPVAWDTVFGWTVLGMYNIDGCQSAISATALIVDPLSAQTTSDQMLFHLWKAEEQPRLESNVHSTEEDRVEAHFTQTHQYLKEERRYQVTLPKTLGNHKLGESRGRALFRGQANERSLAKKKKLKEFNIVMEEYVSLGHAVAVTPPDSASPPSSHYYMPVHAVTKEASTSTKVRAVFDASAPSSTGISLNDLLAVGPTLQSTLVNILLKFRSYPIAISGDISKMYREILLSPEDRPFHRFLWRKQLTEPWQDWEMQRVTFGVTSSPYLAIKTLIQTSQDHGQAYPLAQEHILGSFYVDDFFGGANTDTEAVVLRKQINEILTKGGFTIKKWRSSSPNVLKTIPSELQEKIPDQKLLDSHSACYPKALGLVWDSRKDEMATHVEMSPGYASTKRGVAADIAKTFDVLGWLSPVILVMKKLYRNLWQKKLGWDQAIPEKHQNNHKNWREDMPLLANIRLPRHYCQGKRATEVTLQGFSDASKHAFSAVVYLRAAYESGPPTSALVCSKTRVAPLDERSIPELELCGAHILAKLLKDVSSTLGIATSHIMAYVDNTSVLAWLDGKPKRMKLYVVNRISKTNKLMPPQVWHYVPTKDNPADCASRGLSARELLEHSLWWHGPPWLEKEPLVRPATPGRTKEDEAIDEAHQPKTRQVVAALLPAPDPTFENCSNTWTRVVRVLCWINRFISRARRKSTPGSEVLSVNEMNAADQILKKRSQHRSFSKELSHLLASPPQPLHCKSSLLALHPELDKKGLLCVGGRLRNATIKEKQKHPVILSSKDRYTRLLLKHYHLKLMHAGPTAVLSHSGDQFYISGARRLAREICKSCVICRRAAAKLGPQLMGQLPPARVEPNFVFYNTGLDYAGPYYLKEGYIRRPVTIKCWMAVFVCFCTKAVHLELVKDASSESLVACLGRFCSRRGLPHTIHSDNGSTMVGAKNELSNLYAVLTAKKTQDSISSYLLSQKVQWKMTPVKAPHFGGLWEAAVKAAKYHLKREIGLRLYTYDELETILCHAEACLNSRPLGVMTSHPVDGMTPLTPGHFLVGRALTTYPIAKISHSPGPLAARWDHCNKVTRNFWSRWSNEYLQQLQRAVKWHKPHKNYEVGDIVLLTENETYKTQWITAKVVAVYPGRDGVVRTVDLQIEHITRPEKWVNKNDYLNKLKRRTTVSRRPVAKLSMLLAADELPDDNFSTEDSGTTFQPPPACYVPT